MVGAHTSPTWCTFSYLLITGFLANLLVVRAAKDLKAGDEVTVAYVSAHDSLVEREMKLKV